jgi:MFS family permease
VVSLIQNLRALPRPAWVLFGGTFVNRFGTFVMPFLAIYLSREGFTPAQAGLAISAYGGGHVVASMLGGHMADRIGRRHTIALSMFGSCATMLALSQARTLPSIIALAFAVGMVGELYRPAATALLGDLVPPEQRVAAFGMYRFAINLGVAVGPATAGFLANRSFFYVFAGDAITSFLYGVIALFALPHGVRSKPGTEAANEGVGVALRDRAFLYFLAATLCLTLVEFQLHATVPLYIVSLGYTPATYGLLLSINGALVVVFELAITAWTQRLPQQPMIALGYALSGIGIALMGLATSIPALTATVIVWTIGEMIYAPVSGAYVTALAPERLRGRYMGLWHLMFSAGLLIGPAAGTWIYGQNPAALWWGCLGVGILGGFLALVRTK